MKLEREMVVVLRNKEKYVVIVIPSGLALFGVNCVFQKKPISMKRYNERYRHETSASLDICEIWSKDGIQLWEDYGGWE